MSEPDGPPAFLQAILRRILTGRRGDTLVEDLAELYRHRVRRGSRLSATAWYARQVIGTPLRLLVAARRSNFPPHRDRVHMESVLHDVRHSIRTLARTPTYVAVVVLTLSIGVGINATVFTVVNALLFRPLPIADPGTLVEIYSVDPDVNIPLTSSYPDYLSLVESSTTLEAIAGHSMLAASMTLDGRSELVYGELVTGNYFDLLGIAPHRGRWIGPDDDGLPGAQPVVVLGHDFWRQRFAASDTAIGQSLTLNGRAYAIIGVAPPSFTGMVHGLEAQIWVPTAMGSEIDPIGMQSSSPSPGTTRLERRGSRWLLLKGRLAAGMGVAQVQAELDGVYARLSREYPDVSDGWTPQVLPATSVRVHPLADGYIGPVAAVMMGMVALVLVSACTNIAAMTLSRATARSREIAVRRALGAGTARLVRQLLTETLMLSVLGGAGGIVITLWLRELLLRFQPPLQIPFSWNLPLDVRVIAFTFALALVAGLVFGVAPALRSSRTELVSALKEGARGTEGSGRKLGARGALVVAQVAVCLVLLVGASLLVRSARAATEVDLGFDPGGLLSFTVDMDLLDYEPAEALQFFEAATSRLQALPGVRSVSLASRLPLSLNININGIYVEDLQQTGDESSVQVDAVTVDASYFDTLGVAILRGRSFGPEDTQETPRVAVVSQATADLYFPDGAIGARFHVDNLTGPAVEIVGVAANTKVRTVGEEARPYLYYARGQTSPRSGTFAVRLDRESTELHGTVRSALLDIEPELVFMDDSDMRGIVRAALFPVRFGATMLVSAGVVALLLVSVGLYGVIAYSVARCAKEIGLRMALGADRTDVLALILRRGARLIVAGGIVGVVAAAVLSRALGSVLYGVGALDPVAFGIAFAILAAVATAANWLPARRAARMDPVQALRSD